MFNSLANVELIFWLSGKYKILFKKYLFFNIQIKNYFYSFSIIFFYNFKSKLHIKLYNKLLRHYIMKTILR